MMGYLGVRRRFELRSYKIKKNKNQNLQEENRQKEKNTRKEKRFHAVNEKYFLRRK